MGGSGADGWAGPGACGMRCRTRVGGPTPRVPGSAGGGWRRAGWVPPQGEAAVQGAGAPHPAGGWPRGLGSHHLHLCTFPAAQHCAGTVGGSCSPPHTAGSPAVIPTARLRARSSPCPRKSPGRFADDTPFTCARDKASSPTSHGAAAKTGLPSRAGAEAGKGGQPRGALWSGGSPAVTHSSHRRMRVAPPALASVSSFERQSAA